jgi:hypothetical protein
MEPIIEKMFGAEKRAEEAEVVCFQRVMSLKKQA